jgi:hypothetical protein
VDVDVNNFINGVNYLHYDLDKFFCHDSFNATLLDFNVNDILCQLKFNFRSQFVNNCSICSLSLSSNIHQIHHSFGFLNISPLIISSNVSGFSISPSFNSYLSIQHLYTGVPNFISNIAPIASHINVDLFRELGQGFQDQQIFDLIKYGFSLDLDKSNFISNSAATNHGSAIQFPAAVESYFSSEIQLGSIFGPFSGPPLAGLHCSPLMTVRRTFQSVIL